MHNICKTCGAKDGRCGLTINDECLNCHETRKTGGFIVHGDLVRTRAELRRTGAILGTPKGPTP